MAHRYTKNFVKGCKYSSVQRRDWSSSCQDRRGMCGPISWSVLPVVLGITSTIGFIAIYFFARSNCHVQKWIWPYLSYTGTEYPESMIFGLILNIEGFLGITVVFLAWRYYRHMGQRCCLNRLALCCGGLSCFGVIMVGNFQVTKGLIPHYIGAGLAFIVGTVYGVLTAILSRKAFRVADPPLRYGACIATIRTTLALFMIIELICLTGVGTYKKLNTKKFSKVLNNNTRLKGNNGSCPDILGPIPPLEKYVDLLGSATEWLLTACLLICLSFFAYEFKTFQKVKVVLLRHDGPLRCNADIYETKQIFGSKFSSTVSPCTDASDFNNPHIPQNSQSWSPSDELVADSRFDSLSNVLHSDAISRPSVNMMTDVSGAVLTPTPKDIGIPTSKIRRTRSLPNFIKKDSD